ncbi:hypothetical protein JAAARDRAFT_112591, partial [Jaapia argillacea MUCL 33604]
FIGSFQLKHTLTRHIKSINVLAIDAEGRLLLSGGNDGYIIIWDISSGTLIQKHSESIHGQVTAGAWIDSAADSKAFVFSSADSLVSIWGQSKKKNVFESLGPGAMHQGCIESLNFDPFHHRLATVGGGRLTLWAVKPDWTLSEIVTTPRSEYISWTVHFVNQGKAVIVTYLEFHEMYASPYHLFTARDPQPRICYNANPWSVNWNRCVHTQIGATGLAADGQLLLVSNLDTGTDLYSMPLLQPIRFFNQSMQVLMILPMAFATPESLVVCGSDQGTVSLFNYDDGTLVHSLTHSRSNCQL